MAVDSRVYINLGLLAEGNASVEDVLEHVLDRDTLDAVIKNWKDENDKILFKISLEHYFKDKTFDCCSICQEDILGKRANMKLPCGHHHMHKSCLKMWMSHPNIKLKCPECRMPFTQTALRNLISNKTVKNNTSSVEEEAQAEAPGEVLAEAPEEAQAEAEAQTQSLESSNDNWLPSQMGIHTWNFDGYNYLGGDY